MRRLLALVIVVVGLLVAVDRVALLAAEREVGKRIQREQALATRPDVSIHGFPFLTQVVGGRYDDVTLTVRDLRRGDLPIDRVRADLKGVHISLGDVVMQRFGQVPVDSAHAQVVLTYDDLNEFLRPHGLVVRHGLDPGEMIVRATATVAGQQVSGQAEVRPTVEGDAVVVSAGPGLGFRLSLSDLPFGIRLISAKVTRVGIVVDASAQGLILRTGPS